MADAPFDMLDNRDLDPPGDSARDAPAERPYIGILFACCGVYVRVYRPRDRQFYLGRCPKCLRVVRVRVGRHGTRARQFRAE